MNITKRLVALALGAAVITGVALAVPAGAAKPPKAKTPTVAEVTTAAGLVESDHRTAVMQFQGYYLDQMLVTCQAQVTHTAALAALKRPKAFPKAAWKNLEAGTAAYAKGAGECVTATQYGVVHKGEGQAANAVVDAGLKQVDADWSTGNELVNKALDATLKKAK